MLTTNLAFLDGNPKLTVNLCVTIGCDRKNEFRRDIGWYGKSKATSFLFMDGIASSFGECGEVRGNGFGLIHFFFVPDMEDGWVSCSNSILCENYTDEELASLKLDTDYDPEYPQARTHFWECFEKERPFDFVWRADKQEQEIEHNLGTKSLVSVKSEIEATKLRQAWIDSLTEWVLSAVKSAPSTPEQLRQKFTEEMMTNQTHRARYALRKAEVNVVLGYLLERGILTKQENVYVIN